MKRLGVVIALVFLVCGCRKHDDGSPAAAGGTMPGMGVTTMTHYSGTVAAVSPCGSSVCRQTVSVNADVIDYPNDSVNVYLCKNADCRVSVPATNCASVWNQPPTPCFTPVPSVSIVFAKNIVQFINADQAGYSTYAIDTQVTR